jgi:flagellum-specific peptidoglycan hydrolase FlgJ
VAFTTLPQWTRLRIVEAAAPSPDRIEIEFFGDGSSRQPGLGWVDRADVGPVTPPVPAGYEDEARAFGSEAEFVEEIGRAARGSQRSTGVPASVTIAQAILESDWGRSRLSREAHNLFGIKALAGPGPAGTITLATWEHLGSLDLLVESSFRAYHSLEESVADHAAFLLHNGRYADALALAADPQAFARAINQAGYATDPAYAAKLIQLMDRYDLYRFDDQPT